MGMIQNSASLMMDLSRGDKSKTPLRNSEDF